MHIIHTKRYKKNTKKKKNLPYGSEMGLKGLWESKVTNLVIYTKSAVVYQRSYKQICKEPQFKCNLFKELQTRQSNQYSVQMHGMCYSGLTWQRIGFLARNSWLYQT